MLLIWVNQKNPYEYIDAKKYDEYENFYHRYGYYPHQGYTDAASLARSLGHPNLASEHELKIQSAKSEKEPKWSQILEALDEKALVERQLVQMKALKEELF